MDDQRELFSQVFPIVGWGITVLMNAWDICFSQDIDEEGIESEIQHLQHY